MNQTPHIFLQLVLIFASTNALVLNEPLPRLHSQSSNSNPPDFVRKALNGLHIIGAVSEHPPHLFTEHGRTMFNPGAAYRGGTHFEAFKAASIKFNFTYNIIDAGFNTWDYGTYIQENKSWTGMVSKILGSAAEADLILHCPYDEKFHFLPKAWPMSSSGLIFFVRPGMKILNWYSIFDPLDLTIWILFTCFILTVGFIQAIIIFIQNGFKVSIKVRDSIILRPLALALDQGEARMGDGLRSTSLLILVGSIIIGTGYKSELRQNLLFPKVQRIPTTVEELVQMPDYKVRLTIMGGIEKSLFEHGQSKILRNLKSRLIINHSWFDCFNATFIEDKTVCVVWSGGTRNSFVKHPGILLDPLISSLNTIYSAYNSWAFPPGSALTVPFKWITASLFESGLPIVWEKQVGKFFQWKLRILFKAVHPGFYKILEENIVQQRDDTEKPLKYQNIWIVLVMIGLFHAGSTIVFIAELSYYKAFGKVRTRSVRIQFLH